MTWNFEDLVCQAKNPDKFPQEKDQPIIIWPIILVLLLLAVVAGVACYFVRKNKNKGEKKSETETDQNKGDLMTD